MKKNFAGLGSVLGDKPEETQKGRPKTSTREITKTSQAGTKENETRATFIVNEELLAKFKAIAYWERIKIKKMVATALGEMVAKYEKKNGPVKPIPDGEDIL